MVDDGIQTRPSRASTDQETAPLLQDPEGEWNDGEWNDDASQHLYTSFSKRITSLVHEPLTALTKALLIIALVLLLLSSIFIGLFAGAQHRLHLERERHNGDSSTEKPPVQTVTVTEIGTSITVHPTTVVLTTTTVSTSTTTTTTTAVPAPLPTSPPENTVCLTSQCIILSASILSSIDSTQDPCENFYAFANGGWLNSHPLPADKGRFGTFHVLQQQNKQILQKILELNSTPSASVYDDEILGKLRGLYSSCLDEKTLDSIGTEPLFRFVAIVRQLYRGESTDIPGLSKGGEDKEGTAHGLTAAIAFLHSRGIDALFDFGIDGDVGVDPNHMTLWFSQPRFGLPSKEYYEEESLRELYQSVIERLLLTLSDEAKNQSSQQSPALVAGDSSENVWPPWWPPWGGDDDGDDNDDDDDNRDPAERARDLAKKVVEFENRVANASLDREILQQDPIATYNPLPISNLTESLPEVHFPEYFSAFDPRSFPGTIIIKYPAYPASLSAILNDTSSEAVEAYLVVRAALHLAPFLGLNTEAWKAVRSLDESLKGIKKGAVGDRAEFCVGAVERSLGFAAGRYFVNETFGGESKDRGTRVITDIINSFKASLSHIEWMDKESAKAAAEKADAIRVKVGYPLSPNTTNAKSIARYYGSVEIDENDFFKNMLNAASSDKFKKWLYLGKRRDPLSWEMYPSMVDAYFNPPANEIVFPAGILQPPFFSEHWPSYLSYGAFGHAAAHELTHAFDSTGRLYNQQGKLEQWWTNTTSEGFQAKQDCIVKQYSAYTVDDGKGGVVHVNGNLTARENIGDSGLIHAYRAWKAQYESSFITGNEYVLPGMNYTREQLFFIAFGQVFAQKIKPARAVKGVQTDPHSPYHFRVDGTLSNIPEFAKAFNCSKTARLNPPPEKQCIVW